MACFSSPGHTEQGQTTGAFLQKDSWGARSVRLGMSGGQAETVGVPCHGLSSSSHLEIVGFPV